jgi:hypothetical protein
MVTSILKEINCVQCLLALQIVSKSDLLANCVDDVFEIFFLSHLSSDLSL